MILTKIVKTDFHEKLRKSSFVFFIKISMMKDVCEKPTVERCQFLNIKGEPFSWNSDSVGVLHEKKF